MRIGFITQLLWPRYGQFWQPFVAELGAEVLLPAPEDSRAYLRDTRVRQVQGLAFQCAAAQALALHAAGVDMLIVPQLNPEDASSKGSAQDPWIASFPVMLANQLHNLPPVHAVPTWLEQLETPATTLAQILCPDPRQRRLAWERHRQHSKPPAYPEPQRRRADIGSSFGLIAAPWLLQPSLLSSVAQYLQTQHGAVHVVGQQHFAPSALQQEGQRHDPDLLPTDSEVVGASYRLGRKGDIDALVMLLDRDSSSDAQLFRRVQRHVRKPLHSCFVQDLNPDDAAHGLLV